MTTPGLTLDSEALNALVVKSIVDNLTDEQRAGFISVAVQRLMQVEKDWSGRPKSETPLQYALWQAIEAATHKIARELVENDADLQARLSVLALEGVQQIMADEHSKLREVVGQAIVSALGRKAWDD